MFPRLLHVFSLPIGLIISTTVVSAQPTQPCDLSASSKYGCWESPQVCSGDSISCWNAFPNLQAVHMIMTRIGKVLLFRQTCATSQGSPCRGASLWNPETYAGMRYTTATDDLFCAGHAVLDDGKVLGYAEPNGRAILHSCPIDTYLPLQWSLRNTGAPTPQQPTCTSGADIQFCDAYEITPGSLSTKIGIIDSGVGPHDELLGKVEGDPDTSVDPHPGHGTHVAGIVAAWTNGGGIAGVDGLAQIVSRTVGSADQNASRLRDAVDNGKGAVIVNNSWEMSYDASFSELNTVRGAFRDIYMLDCVAVASMGNQGSPIPSYPAAFGQGIIAVGSTDCQDQRADHSNTGDHIDVAAPGVDIWSTVPLHVASPPYFYHSGTSQAAPQVSGLAGLLLAAKPELCNDDVEQVIRLSADDVNQSSFPGFDNFLGMGRINAFKALKLLQHPYAMFQETVAGGTAVDSTNQYTLWFHVPPDSNYQAENYRVRRFEVRQAVIFPTTFDSLVGVWGRGVATTGYSVETGTGQRAGNWNMGWCEPIAGTITSSGCSLRTFVYEVKSFPAGNPVGWWPARYDNVQFGYTALGTATVADAGSDRAGTTLLVPRLWSANPLRPGATLAFAITQTGKVRIDLFDVAGRRIRVLQDGPLSQGRHELQWNGLTDKGSAVAAGLYFVRLETPGAAVVTRKLVVLE